MAYIASVMKVMIASPGDVQDERQVVREIINEWNTIHSEDRKIVLLPVGWETHSSPLLGARAQEVINHQVLEGCDLLVAVFWTRLGSPTGESPSGTVEEIRKHLAAGKPAMIYFSSAPVRLDSVDDKQYSALKEFRTECFDRGLVETYNSIHDFREKFSRQLAQTAIRQFKTAVPEPEAERLVRSTVPHEMSQAAKELLLTAAEDPNSAVLKMWTSSGLLVRSHKREFVDRKDPRSAAQWESAISELVDLGFLIERGTKGESFTVTHSGYTEADRLRQEGTQH